MLIPYTFNVEPQSVYDVPFINDDRIFHTSLQAISPNTIEALFTGIALFISNKPHIKQSKIRIISNSESITPRDDIPDNTPGLNRNIIEKNTNHLL